MEYLLVHGLDVDKTSFSCFIQGFYLVIFLDESALLFEELTDVTSLRLENFLIHGHFSPFFLLVDLNKSNMEIKDSRNIMYIT